MKNVVIVCLVLLSASAVGAQEDCSILYYPWYTDHPYFLDRIRLTSLGYEVAGAETPADLAYANLQQHDVLVVFLVGPGVIGDYQDDIAQWVAEGGALYIHQPDAVGVVDYAPTGFEVEVTSAAMDTCGTDGCLTDAVHPITAGLASGDLTGVHDRVGTVGDGYTDLLAISCGCGTPALLVGAHGDGVVAFDAGNLAYGSPTSDAYVTQLLDYLCEAGTVAVQAVDWGEMKASFR